MADFLHFMNMGGYGFYVWSAYGLVALVLALHLVLPWRRFRKLSKKHKAAAHAQTQ